MQPDPAGSAPSCRLYAILARDGRTAVIFRRGPSRQVRLLRWWLDGDRIEPGQWLKGRIYARRCDLSPDGELLVYFAAKWETPMAAWTAVSRPPYLTALALWPKGDAWGGGGLFHDQATLGLNHTHVTGLVIPNVAIPWHPLAEKPEFPAGICVQAVAGWAGGGEDDPIEFTRMLRDGWQFIAAGKRQSGGRGRVNFITMEEPEVYDRPSPLNEALVLRRSLHAIGQRNGPWNVEHFDVRSARGSTLRQIGECGWANWQSTGDLLFSRDGRLYRLPAACTPDAPSDPMSGAVMIADLTDMRFESVIAPPSATQWPK